MISENAFCVEITPASYGVMANPIILYVSADEADFQAKKLSAAFSTADVRLTRMARVKAVYENGERVRLYDYRKFYTLSDEEYEATLIKDAKTAEMI